MKDHCYFCDGAYKELSKSSFDSRVYLTCQMCDIYIRAMGFNNIKDLVSFANHIKSQKSYTRQEVKELLNELYNKIGAVVDGLKTKDDKN
jgi:hypothetical protein